ncbi:MAG: hypothetical protein PHE25_04385, partial [Candidatus Gracilibacteria bacterium]|nr:hypothetical protein [Candidatus Gracilibacteria bacterium]
EDATNTDINFLIECTRIAIIAGANILNIPDTLGIATPDSYKTLFHILTQETQDLKQKGYNFEFSTHVHNDKAMALATALGGVKGGARQIESTMLGIGERTGNTKTHEIVMACEIDGKTNGGFQINGLKTYLFAIFCNVIKSILQDDSFTREPGIGTNAQTDGSGVHTANPNLYGGSKKYSASFGIIPKEGFFSARGGKNTVRDLLASLGFERDFFKEEIILKLIPLVSKKAEISRTLYPSQIFRDYLELNGDLKNFSYEILENNIKVSFSLFGKNIIINENFSQKEGFIDVLIEGFKKNIGKKINISLKDYSSKEKASLKSIIDELKNGIEKLKQNGYDGVSEFFDFKLSQILSSISLSSQKNVFIIYFVFDVNGVERNSLTFDNNLDKAMIKGIIDVFLPFIF